MNNKKQTIKADYELKLKKKKTINKKFHINYNLADTQRNSP